MPIPNTTPDPLTSTGDVSNGQDFLSPLHFEFALSKIPGVTFLCQRFKLPDITTSNVVLPTPFKDTPLPADHQKTSQIQMEFLVDDAMQNYSQLYLWMQDMTFPRDYTQRVSPKESDLYCQGSLSILDYHHQPHIQIQFSRVLPSYLSGPWLDATKQDFQYLTATAAFDFSQFDIIRT